MASVFDVAAYILKKRGQMTTMKLQKLVYYAQAWSLVWDDRALFDERIQAWANGPVCPDLYQAHRGRFDITDRDIQGNLGVLDNDASKSIDAVVGYYGDKSSHWLSQLTHEEPPWKDARAGLTAGVRGTSEITHAAMAEYYGSL